MKNLMMPLLFIAIAPRLTALAAPTEGLVLHLDAHTIAGPGQPKGAAVAIWKDLSGKGHDGSSPWRQRNRI